MLFRTHFKGLCSFALKYVKDLDSAKEIVQDSFLSLWEKREYIDLSKPVKSYLTTAIYNKSLNYLRDNKKFNSEILNFEALYPFNENDKTDKLVTSELNRRIHDSINELPVKCREIFIMNRFEDLKYREIAEKLDISIKTVETQMSKALQHMRNRLVEFLPIFILIIHHIIKIIF
ncbi:MAG: RNA polymerase sigma-70 factor [Bacteroidota bacterium]